MRILVIAVCLLLFSVPLAAATGLITVESAFDVATTADRFEKVVKQNGMTVLNRIDHAAAASAVGVSLRPTVLVIFGNPKIGSQLMKCSPTVAIDLPEKALIWQDKHGAVWLSYNNPDYLDNRHGLAGCEQTLSKISKALMTFATAAATP